MHYTGIGIRNPRPDRWDPTLVAASIALGALIGTAALPIGLREDNVKWKILGALLLTAAICSHHFTAMGAAKIILDPVYVMPNKRRSPRLAATSAYIQRAAIFRS
jgi:diguanylate cyclase